MQMPYIVHEASCVTYRDVCNSNITHLRKISDENCLKFINLHLMVSNKSIACKQYKGYKGSLTLGSHLD